MYKKKVDICIDFCLYMLSIIVLRKKIGICKYRYRQLRLKNKIGNRNRPRKFPSVHLYSQLSSLGYTIMGKTADLTVVQKTIIDTLHKEGKPQTFIAKEAGCSQCAVSKHVNRTLSGRKKCGRKRCTTN